MLQTFTAVSDSDSGQCLMQRHMHVTVSVTVEDLFVPLLNSTTSTST